jgi:hypothetical protein
MTAGRRYTTRVSGSPSTIVTRTITMTRMIIRNGKLAVVRMTAMEMLSFGIVGDLCEGFCSLFDMYSS